MDLKQIFEAQQAALKTFEEYKKETSAKVAAYDGKLVDVDATLKVLKESVDQLGKHIKARSVGADFVDNAKKETKDDFSVVNMLFKPNSAERKLSIEYMREREKAFGEEKDLSQSTDSAGGFTIPAQALPGFLEALRSAAVVWPQAGITVFDNVKGSPLTLPKQIGNTSVQWVGENVAPTPTDVTFGQVTMTPKKAAGLVKISNRLIRMGSIAEQVVRQNLSYSLALEIDRVLLRGSGAAGEPRGIANTAGIINVEVDVNGGPFTFEVAADMQVAVDETDAVARNQSYVGHPRAFHSMKTERIAQFTGQTAGAYVVLPMSNAQISELLGFKFLQTTQIPKNLTKGSGTALTEVYFGNWADLYFALWQDITLKASDTTGDASGSAFTQDQLWIMGQIECDVAIVRPTSFALVNDATTT